MKEEVPWDGFGLTINSRHLLIHTDLTMGQIADRAGFSGSGYFAERFRQYFRCTPAEYRRIHKLQ